MELNPGAMFGDYQIVGRLGRGTMGVVYQARDGQGRSVAIKVIVADLASDPATRERFLREAKAVSRLRHRNIVTVYSFGVHEEVPYICMELLGGATLAQSLSRGDRVGVAGALNIIVQLCEGLQYAHDQGVVHRDVKPANIWLLDNGGVKLLDFGVAKSAESTMTRSGDMVGSAAYMAPEQIAGEPVDGRADVFAAGAVLYQLLAGHGPFEADSLTAVVNRVLHHTPASLRTRVPGLPDAVVLAVEKALEKDRNGRYARASEFGADLRIATYMLSRPAGQDAPEENATVVAPSLERRAEARLEQKTMLAPVTPSGGRAAVDNLWDGTAPLLAAGSTRPAPAGTAAGKPALWPSSGMQWSFIGAIAIALAAVAAGLWSVAFRPAPTFHIDVSSTPPGASIAFDGVATESKTPAVLTLMRRPSRVTVSLDGFEPVDAPLTPGSGADPAPVRLTLRRLLMVRSEPTGARILLGGVDTGLVTPAAVPLTDPRPPFLEVQVGDRRSERIALTADLLAAGAVSATVPTGQGAVPKPGAATGPPPDRGGAENVMVHVIGGYLFAVDGCGMNSPPASEHTLQVRSPCTLRLRAPQYHLNAARSIPAASGQVEIAAPQLARVQLRTKHEGCSVIIEGRSLGSPPIDVELAAGSYDFAIACQDQTLLARGIPIEPGRSVRRLDDYVR
jgi:hypothetical protein